MAEWIYFIHPPRPNSAEGATDEEREGWGRHWERAKALFQEGRIVVMGPTLGPHNTGICVFEAPAEDSARRFMEEDPAIAEGFAKGELRPFRVSLLRGRV